MAQVLDLNIVRHVLEAGADTRNPMGLRIRLETICNGAPQDVRMYFYYPDDDESAGVLGWRASDNALVLFLQHRDYAAYALLFDQARARHMQAALNDDDDIEYFYLTTDPLRLHLLDSKTRKQDLEEFQTRRRQ